MSWQTVFRSKAGTPANSQLILGLRAWVEVTAHCSTTIRKLRLWKTQPAWIGNFATPRSQREGILKSFTRMRTVYAHKRAIVEV